MELVAEFLGIVDGGFDFWVTDFTAFGIDLVTSFELGDFFAEVFHDDGRFDRVDIHRNVENFVDVDKGGNPTGIKGAGIAVDVDGSAVFRAKTEIARVDFDGAWGDEIAEGGDALFKGLLNFSLFGVLGLDGDFGGSKLSRGFIFSRHLVSLLYEHKWWRV